MENRVLKTKKIYTLKIIIIKMYAKGDIWWDRNGAIERLFFFCIILMVLWVIYWNKK